MCRRGGSFREGGGARGGRAGAHRRGAVLAGGVDGLRLYRAAVFIGVVLMMHRGAPPVVPGELVGASLADLREFFPSAASFGGGYVSDATGNELGFAVTTSPESDGIVGYSGANNLLVAFGADGKVIGVKVLSSGDTPEHLDQVLADEEFLASFDGMTWDEVKAVEEVDGVSGATLTSLAMAEGVIGRLTGSAPSLRFPVR